jgi:hypothetical protein
MLVDGLPVDDAGWFGGGRAQIRRPFDRRLHATAGLWLIESIRRMADTVV